jgi:hypothetical protein
LFRKRKTRLRPRRQIGYANLSRLGLSESRMTFVANQTPLLNAARKNASAASACPRAQKKLLLLIVP